MGEVLTTADQDVNLAGPTDFLSDAIPIELSGTNHQPGLTITFLLP